MPRRPRRSADTALPPLLSDQQIARDLSHAGLTPAQITETTGLSRPAVAHVAASVKDAREAAKETLQAGANDLATRVVRKANVAESIDVLERLEVLQPKRGDGRGGSQVQIVIGMPDRPIGPDLSPLVFDASPAPMTDQQRTAEIARLEAALVKARRQ